MYIYELFSFPKHQFFESTKKKDLKTLQQLQKLMYKFANFISKFFALDFSAAPGMYIYLEHEACYAKTPYSSLSNKETLSAFFLCPQSILQ